MLDESLPNSRSPSPSRLKDSPKPNAKVPEGVLKALRFMGGGDTTMKRNPFDPDSWKSKLKALGTPDSPLARMNASESVGDSATAHSLASQSGGAGGTDGESRVRKTAVFKEQFGASVVEAAPPASLGANAIARAFGSGGGGMKHNPFDPTSWVNKSSGSSAAASIAKAFGGGGDEVQRNPFDPSSWKKNGTVGGGVKVARSKDQEGTRTAPKGGHRGLLKPIRSVAWDPLRLEVAGAAAASIPKRRKEAADAFDGRHRKLTAQAHRIEVAHREDPMHIAKEGALLRSIWETGVNRYFEREKLAAVQRYETGGRKAKKEAVPEAWSLEKSIWWPRTKWCDAKDLWDSEDFLHRMFIKDWRRSLECGLRGYIARHDDGGQGSIDEEVEEVEAVLWENHLMVYLLFDYYAAMGSSNDIFSITLNAYSQFVQDFKLIEKKSQTCTRTAFDQLFIAVDSSNAGGKVEEKYNRKKALDRQEFLQVLVRAAVMKYISTGKVDDVSTAVHAFFSMDINPRADRTIFRDPNASRNDFYKEEIDLVLRKHQVSLRLVFQKTCIINGISMEVPMVNKLVSYVDYKEFLHLFNIINIDLTERDATLCFCWSRMSCLDEQDEKMRTRWTHLAFEDFLEALCRLAALKALPTDEEIAEAGVSNAGTYLRQLKMSDADAYHMLLRTRAPEFGKPPLQPLPRAIDHFIECLIVECQHGRDDELVLSEKDVNGFMFPNAGSTAK